MQLFLPQPPEDILVQDERMRHKLADSLEYVCDQSLTTATESVDLEGMLSAIRRHRVQPGIFGRYFDLVLAAKAKQYDKANVLLHEIGEMAPISPFLKVLPLTAAAMGDDADRFAKLLDPSRTGSVFGPPSEQDWRGFETHVGAAFDILDAVDAALAAEARALIMLVIGSIPSDTKRSFGSASSLTLWGAILMNLKLHAKIIDIVDGLVHEAAHQLLFGYAVDGPLLANSPHERHASPLRADPRPMEGVYHATFVCARLHFLYSRLLECRPAGLNEIAESVLVERRMLQKRKFRDGVRVVETHGKLNRVGAAVMQDTVSYIDQVAV